MLTSGMSSLAVACVIIWCLSLVLSSSASVLAAARRDSMHLGSMVSFVDTVTGASASVWNNTIVVPNNVVFASLEGRDHMLWSDAGKTVFCKSLDSNSVFQVLFSQAPKDQQLFGLSFISVSSILLVADDNSIRSVPLTRCAGAARAIETTTVLYSESEGVQLGNPQWDVTSNMLYFARFSNSTGVAEIARYDNSTHANQTLKTDLNKGATIVRFRLDITDNSLYFADVALGIGSVRWLSNGTTTSSILLSGTGYSTIELIRGGGGRGTLIVGTLYGSFLSIDVANSSHVTTNLLNGSVPDGILWDSSALPTGAIIWSFNPSDGNGGYIGGEIDVTSTPSFPLQPQSLQWSASMKQEYPGASTLFFSPTSPLLQGQSGPSTVYFVSFGYLVLYSATLTPETVSNGVDVKQLTSVANTDLFGIGVSGDSSLWYSSFPDGIARNLSAGGLVGGGDREILFNGGICQSGLGSVVYDDGQGTVYATSGTHLGLLRKDAQGCTAIPNTGDFDDRNPFTVNPTDSSTAGPVLYFTSNGNITAMSLKTMERQTLPVDTFEINSVTGLTFDTSGTRLIAAAITNQTSNFSILVVHAPFGGHWSTNSLTVLAQASQYGCLCTPQYDSASSSVMFVYHSDAATSKSYAFDIDTFELRRLSVVPTDSSPNVQVVDSRGLAWYLDSSCFNRFNTSSVGPGGLVTAFEHVVCLDSARSELAGTNADAPVQFISLSPDETIVYYTRGWPQQLLTFFMIDVATAKSTQIGALPGAIIGVSFTHNLLFAACDGGLCYASFNGTAILGDFLVAGRGSIEYASTALVDDARGRLLVITDSGVAAFPQLGNLSNSSMYYVYAATGLSGLYIDSASSTLYVGTNQQVSFGLTVVDMAHNDSVLSHLSWSAGPVTSWTYHQGVVYYGSNPSGVVSDRMGVFSVDLQHLEQPPRKCLTLMDSVTLAFEPSNRLLAWTFVYQTEPSDDVFILLMDLKSGRRFRVTVPRAADVPTYNWARPSTLPHLTAVTSGTAPAVQAIWTAGLLNQGWSAEFAVPSATAPDASGFDSAQAQLFLDWHNPIGISTVSTKLVISPNAKSVSWLMQYRLEVLDVSSGSFASLYPPVPYTEERGAVSVEDYTVLYDADGQTVRAVFYVNSDNTLIRQDSSLSFSLLYSGNESVKLVSVTADSESTPPRLFVGVQVNSTLTSDTSHILSLSVDGSHVTRLANVDSVGSLMVQHYGSSPTDKPSGNNWFSDTTRDALVGAGAFVFILLVVVTIVVLRRRKKESTPADRLLYEDLGDTDSDNYGY